jgi:hypothetical protein
MFPGFKNEVFHSLVDKIWRKNGYSVDPIKVKRFKKYFKGWGSNIYGHNKKKKWN